MKRISLFLDDKLLRSLRRMATRRGVSVAAIVRQAVASYLAESPVAESLPSIAGWFASGMRDTSARVDDLLWSDPHG